MQNGISHFPAFLRKTAALKIHSMKESFITHVNLVDKNYISS